MRRWDILPAASDRWADWPEMPRKNDGWEEKKASHPVLENHLRSCRAKRRKAVLRRLREELPDGEGSHNGDFEDKAASMQNKAIEYLDSQREKLDRALALSGVPKEVLTPLIYNMHVYSCI